MSWTGNPFKPANLTLDPSFAPDQSYQLAFPELGSSTNTAPNLGNYASQLAPYSEPPPSGIGSGPLVGAGIGAAGSTIGTLAQLVGQQFARNTTATQNQLGRDVSAKLAKMQLAAELNMANKTRQANMQQYLLNAIQNQIGNSIDAYDTNRMANQGVTNLIANAFTAPRG